MNTCVTTPALRCQRSTPLSAGACRNATLSSCPAIHSEPGTSVMPPSRPFSGRVRTSSSSPRVTTKAAPRRSVSGLLRRLARKRLLIAAQAGRAIIIQRAQRASRLLRRADRGAEIHQRLRAVAGARLSSPARCQQRRRQFLDARLGLRQRFFHRIQPRHHALDVAVDRHGPGGRRRSRRWRLPCTARSPAICASLPRCRETPRHGRAARPPRRRADCAPANSSRARPTSAARRPARPRPSAATSGQRARNFSKYGPTVLTPVCCSMISDSQTRYGSARSPAGGRHGSRRRWRSYQSSSSAGRSALSVRADGRLDLAAAEEVIETL